MPELREILTLDYWRDHALAAAYVAAGLLFFTIAMFSTFPYDRALSSALAPVGLQLTYTGQHSAFPMGAVLENVRLASLKQAAAPPLFQSESLRLTPGLAILIGRPAVSIKADIYEGEVKASVSRAGELTAVVFRLNHVNLGQYSYPPAFGGGLKGLISGDGSFEIADTGTNPEMGSAELQSQDLAVSIAKGLPAIKFSQAKGSFKVEHGLLRINHLEATGPDVAISGTGDIHIGATPAQTTMQLSLRITPTMAGRSHLGFLLAFLPHPPDSRLYVLTGPLTHPSIS